ncbi:cellulase family glycosylhydrolase [Candidatus Bathycorpusculum sp.]|uniref:glycoside hydrolase family 5 protein n=1 Tax=Candidatus Bathycorpusculum sp. TaxID=2994959 RepID=UPI00281C2EE2|nr:glycoside hydrolase family 5 protein [Candidatus Termitimicrobium sp.]MCL2432733.1 glycoside hydrolase family 5 protein [Candidatus Termitimicrobium sp.]
MKTNIFGKTLHTTHFKRATRPIVICISALFIISMVAPLAIQPVQAATPALHTSGSQIIDADGNVIYLRGVGVAGFAPNLIFWGQGQSDSWSNQWNTNPTAVMEQTFTAMRDQWHINYIRVFIYPSWYYRDSITPAQEDSNYASQTTPISTKAYLRTLCAEAAKYGIYVNIVPYMLTPPSSSAGNDPYATPNFAGGQGLPMSGWDSAAQRFLSDAGYANNELAFWQWFWADMANNLKDYPNAIFEAWNEPQIGADNTPIPSAYLQYLQTMYNAIRGTGSNHLIMMQWRVGWFPNGYGNTLSWTKQISDAIPTATNLIYTTHLYYYAPTDLTPYWATDYNTLKTQLQSGINSMGVNAPLVINEQGSCLTSSRNRQNDYTWWQNLLLAQRDLGIGAGAYYWLSDAGLGPVYSGETMLSNGYAPNTMGQHFINAYKPSTTNPTAIPTITPTPTTTPITPNPTTTLTTITTTPTRAPMALTTDPTPTTPTTDPTPTTPTTDPTPTTPTTDPTPTETTASAPDPTEESIQISPKSQSNSTRHTKHHSTHTPTKSAHQVREPTKSYDNRDSSLCFHRSSWQQHHSSGSRSHKWSAHCR